jgi:hypothetical protein
MSPTRLGRRRSICIAVSDDDLAMIEAVQVLTGSRSKRQVLLSGRQGGGASGAVSRGC